MGNQIRKRLTVVAVALMALTTLSAQNKNGQTDSLVRLMKAQYIEQLQINGRPYRKAIDATFLHNGTYFMSDTALWNLDEKIINAIGNVKVIQDETVLTSEKMDYLIDDNLAQFRGTLVQLQNRKKNLLRTRNLDYNTKDSMAVFRNGAAMRDKDGQLIESTNGTYSSSRKEFDFLGNVNMFSDSVFVKTQELSYESERNLAKFRAPIDFWKGGNMLSANRGEYYRDAELFCFYDNVHGTTMDQESWSDTLFFYRNSNNVQMYGHVQLTDTTRNVNALSNYLNYEDTTSTVTLKRDAAVAMRTEQEGKTDTLYIGADELKYCSRMRFQITEDEIKDAKGRIEDMHVDPVLEYRQKAAKARAEAAAKAAEEADDGSKPGAGPAGKPGAPGSKGALGKSKLGRGGAGLLGKKSDKKKAESEKPDAADSGLVEEEEAPAVSAKADSLRTSRVDSLSNRLGQITDSLTGKIHQRDTLAMHAQADSLKAAIEPGAPVDSSMQKAAADTATMQPGDTLAGKDSIPPVLDSTKVGFMWAHGKVKIFRKDLQVRCDSLCYSELDSIARFYKEPIIWNDGNRQYSSDSLYVLVNDGGVDRASLQSNAFVIIQEDSLCFDQIKGAEVMAYFDSTSALRRFDALGGANAIFYLQENNTFATINKVECKMLSATLANGDLDMVYYFDSPHNNAYPVVQLPESEQRMKGFNWQPENRPSGREDITVLELRPSERSAYARKPRARFDQTQIYFPGYMPGILRQIAVRDSLAKIPHKAVVADTLAVGDSLKLSLADSLAVSAGMPDSLSNQIGAVRDSLATGSPAVADSLAAKNAIDPLAVPTTDPKQLRREQAEQARALRQAARDAKAAAREKHWQELDAKDAAKAQAKAQKALEKKRAATLKKVKARLKQEAKDEAKLQYYIQKYRKKKANDERRQQKSISSGERTPRTERGRELSAPDAGQPVTEGSDPVLSDDGSSDDGAVLGGGSVPGA